MKLYFFSKYRGIIIITRNKYFLIIVLLHLERKYNIYVDYYNIYLLKNTD